MEEIHQAIERHEWLTDSQFLAGIATINQKCDQLKYDVATRKAMIDEAKLFYFQK